MSVREWRRTSECEGIILELKSGKTFEDAENSDSSVFPSLNSGKANKFDGSSIVSLRIPPNECLRMRVILSEY